MASQASKQASKARPKPRALTLEETREQLLQHFRATAQYWAQRPGKTEQERCDGLAMALLATFDGVGVDIPPVKLVVSPDEADMQRAREFGLNWYRPGMVLNDPAQDGTDLHDLYYPKDRPHFFGYY